MTFSRHLSQKEEITSFEAVTLTITGMRGTQVYEVLPRENEAEFSLYTVLYRKGGDERRLERRAVRPLSYALAIFNDCELLSWNGFRGNHPRGVLDGTMFSFEATFNGGKAIRANGSENFPDHYRAFTDALRQATAP